jgi:hypothetical protein
VRSHAAEQAPAPMLVLFCVLQPLQLRFAQFLSIQVSAAFAHSNTAIYSSRRNLAGATADVAVLVVNSIGNW